MCVYEYVSVAILLHIYMGDLYIKRILKNCSIRLDMCIVIRILKRKTSWNLHNNKIIVDSNLLHLIGAFFPLHFIPSIYSQFFWCQCKITSKCERRKEKAIVIWSIKEWENMKRKWFNLKYTCLCMFAVCNMQLNVRCRTTELTVCMLVCFCFCCEEQQHSIHSVRSKVEKKWVLTTLTYYIQFTLATGFIKSETLTKTLCFPLNLKKKDEMNVSTPSCAHLLHSITHTCICIKAHMIWSVS